MSTNGSTSIDFFRGQTDRAHSEGLTREVLLKERLSTVDLLSRVACIVKKVKIFSVKEGTDLDWLVQGGQLY